jgi:hypothetical protein
MGCACQPVYIPVAAPSLEAGLEAPILGVTGQDLGPEPRPLQTDPPPGYLTHSAPQLSCPAY